MILELHIYFSSILSIPVTGATFLRDLHMHELHYLIDWAATIPRMHHYCLRVGNRSAVIILFDKRCQVLMRRSIKLSTKLSTPYPLNLEERF